MQGHDYRLLDMANKMGIPVISFNELLKIEAFREDLERLSLTMLFSAGFYLRLHSGGEYIALSKIDNVTLAHELGHAAGSARRVNRPSLINSKHDKDSADLEEAIADFVAVNLCIELGLPVNELKYAKRMFDYTGSIFPNDTVKYHGNKAIDYLRSLMNVESQAA